MGVPNARVRQLVRRRRPCLLPQARLALVSPGVRGIQRIGRGSASGRIVEAALSAQLKSPQQ